MTNTCPKCHLQGVREPLEKHHCSSHSYCKMHGWMSDLDIQEYWDAINEFKSRGSKPSGATALQVANEAC